MKTRLPRAGALQVRQWQQHAVSYRPEDRFKRCRRRAGQNADNVAHNVSRFDARRPLKLGSLSRWPGGENTLRFHACPRAQRRRVIFGRAFLDLKLPFHFHSRLVHESGSCGCSCTGFASLGVAVARQLAGGVWRVQVRPRSEFAEGPVGGSQFTLDAQVTPQCANKSVWPPTTRSVTNVSDCVQNSRNMHK
jgi:hypothetical protein